MFSGHFMVSRVSRAEKEYGPGDYTTCISCHKTLLAIHLRHHNARCTKTNCSNQRSLQIESRKTCLLISKYAKNPLRRRIFPVLRQNDAVVNAIRFDDTVIIFGNFQADKYRESNHIDDMIRTKLRRLGRFLLIAREVSQEFHKQRPLEYPKISQMSDIYEPSCKFSFNNTRI